MAVASLREVERTLDMRSKFSPGQYNLEGWIESYENHGEMTVQWCHLCDVSDLELHITEDLHTLRDVLQRRLPPMGLSWVVVPTGIRIQKAWDSSHVHTFR